MKPKLIQPLLLGTLISFGATPVHAQTAAQTESKAAASEKEAPPYGGWGPGYGMGPGMMGGYGMGPGMMGGYGMGPGWGGYGPQGLPDLTADQRAKIFKIQDETRRKHWELMGQMMDEQARLRDLYDAPKQDSAAVTKAYAKISALQRQMYESSADAQKRIEAVLTKEQKEKSWRFWRHW